MPDRLLYACAATSMPTFVTRMRSDGRRWAGRFLAARAAGDEATCAALVNSCTTDEEFATNVAALVQVVAATLNMVGVP